MEDLDQMIDYLNHEPVSFVSSECSLVSEKDLFGRALIKLYKEKQFYQILTILPPFEQLVYVMPSIRLIIALTLFRLGRFKAALRELAIAIEMEPDPLEKERLIHYQVRLFRILKLDNRIGSCINEISELKRVGKVLAPQGLDSVIVDNKFLDIHFELDPIHVQALNYTNNCGELPAYSLGKTCIVVNDLVQKSIDLLTKHGSPKSNSLDPLTVLFEASKYFSPTYLFQPIVDKHGLLETYMKNKLAKYFELDLSMNVKSLVEMLIELENNSSNTLNHMANLVIQHQFTQGFLQYLKGNYKESLSYFIWILLFVSAIEQKSSRYINKTQYLSYLTKRVCCIFVIKCAEFGSIDFSSLTLQGIFNKLIENAEQMNTAGEFFSSRYCQFFISSGIVHEHLAVKGSKSILSNNNEIIERYNCGYLMEMIRNYIIASGLMFQDDHKILVIVDRIVWGLLMYGGIHLQTIWFFQAVRNYYQLTLDFGPIHYHQKSKLQQQEPYKLFAKESIEYENYHDILNKINELSNQLTGEDILNIWDYDHDEFLLPVIFKHQDKLLIMDQFYDEKSPFVFDKSNLTVGEFYVLVKLKSQCKISSEVIKQKFDVSKELIELWITTFERYQGPVPPMIQASSNL